LISATKDLARRTDMLAGATMTPGRVDGGSKTLPRDRPVVVYYRI
jgi:hypothetical protein